MLSPITEVGGLVGGLAGRGRGTELQTASLLLAPGLFSLLLEGALGISKVRQVLAADASSKLA